MLVTQLVACQKTIPLICAYHSYYHNRVLQSEKCITNYYAFGFENCIKCALKVKHVLKHVNFNIHVSDSMNIDMCITQLPLSL